MMSIPPRTNSAPPVRDLPLDYDHIPQGLRRALAGSRPGLRDSTQVVHPAGLATPHRRLHVEVRDILARVPHEEYSVLRDELLALPIHQSDEKDVKLVAKTFFEKTIHPEETPYAESYVSLIDDMLQHIGVKDATAIVIRKGIVTQCQAIFENTVSMLVDPESARAESMNNQEFEISRKLINEKNLANINLLGLFFVNGFVNERIVTNVLFILLYGPPDRRSSSRLPADFEVEMFLELLLKVGKNISQRTKQFLDQFIFTMTELSTYHPSKRIQLKLLHSLMIVHNGFELTNDIRGNENIAVKPKRSTPLFPHVSLGDVAVMASIGRGSSCVVHRCEWRGRTYALKQYHKDVVRDIAREVAVAPYLQHPSIVRVAAIVDSSDGERQTVGLLMELASLSLAGVLASHSRPSQATILRWLHEVAQGIEFAHECRVVHSDIKPENIMTIVHSQEHVVAKVTDFGSASILSTAGPATTTVRGTPMFIAPEYGAGDTGPTKASDVFSFGMTMWCALVPQGTDHGLGKIDVQVCRALDRGRRPPVAALDPLHAHLIERCWATDPSARPSMVEVEETLRNWVASTEPIPSLLLWSTLLKPFGMEAAYQGLKHQQHGRIFLSDVIYDRTNACHRLVCSLAGSLSNSVNRVVVVGTDAPTADAFVTLHEAEVNSRAVNPSLRVKNQTDVASVAGLDRLKQLFIPVVTAPGESLPSARLLFAWHGTALDKVVAVCRDGPRSLRTTDCGYFGPTLPLKHLTLCDTAPQILSVVSPL